MSLTAIEWNGFPAYAIESDQLRVVTLPTMGAKLVSIYDKQAQREWLTQPKAPQHEIPYGTIFDKFEMYAWDEMFPTIHVVDYPEDGPYKGVPLPDHGEVWPIAWTREGNAADELTLGVDGRVLPYHLTRTASVAGQDAVRLSYSATNTGSAPFACLYAAHPLFAVDDQTQIILPHNVKEVYNVALWPAWGERGRRYAWPNAQTDNGKVWDLRHIGPTSLKDGRKVYVSPEQRIDWAGLRQSDSGAWMRLEWDGDKLPYLGLWIDEGIYVRAAALEPTDGFYDEPVTALANGKIRHLQPGDTRTWDITIRVNSGSAPIEK
jgi:galactose mutarotase-like enzyme